MPAVVPPVIVPVVTAMFDACHVSASELKVSNVVVSLPVPTHGVEPNELRFTLGKV